MLRMALIRIQKGIKQKELAQQIGKAINSVSGYENGIITPNLTTILQIKKALNYHKDDLFEEIEVGEDFKKKRVITKNKTKKKRKGKGKLNGKAQI